MKQTIRLNESELRHLIKESVKRVLREVAVPKNTYCWEINELCEIENGKYDVLDNMENSGQIEYKTEEDAYRDGINALKQYRDGDYELVVYFIDVEGSDMDMVCGAEIHDGKITEY